jgi:hypothetical protein
MVVLRLTGYATTAFAVLYVEKDCTSTLFWLTATGLVWPRKSGTTPVMMSDTELKRSQEACQNVRFRIPEVNQLPLPLNPAVPNIYGCTLYHVVLLRCPSLVDSFVG